MYVELGEVGDRVLLGLEPLGRGSLVSRPRVAPVMAHTCPHLEGLVSEGIEESR